MEPEKFVEDSDSDLSPKTILMEKEHQKKQPTQSLLTVGGSANSCDADTSCDAARDAC